MSIVLGTKARRGARSFAANAGAHRELLADLDAQRERARAGGGSVAAERHAARGKLLVRERVRLLLDDGAPWHELSPMAAHGLYDGDAPAAGIVTAVGRVHGREVVVVANDATVKGGAYFPMTVKKHLRAQEIALHNRLPCIYLVDSGGAYLPLQDEIFPDREHFGRIFFNQATMSAAGIAQIAAVMGSCTAGGAYVPAMSDETVIVREQGTIFLAGPPLVKAATGEQVSAEELGGGDLHARESGVVDHLADDDAHALAIVRSIVATLGPRAAAPWERIASEPPAVDPAQLYGAVPVEPRKG
ncbi:MAG TPA: carboxyl transferase domain-containing protein, partial [Solirubrobacteraceae bacterium]|nr:carboxyl transferase domain-containing protein [Solirubrobacteraceae bacterium]